MAFMAE